MPVWLAALCMLFVLTIGRRMARKERAERLAREEAMRSRRADQAG
jgi:hypothetical protein